MLGLTHDPLAGSATSLRDHGMLDRPARRAALQVVGSYPVEATYAGYYFDSAFTASPAAVEAVIGRVVRMFRMATVVSAGGRRSRNKIAPRLLSAPTRGMIARSLMERGESLHYLDAARMELQPADHGWDVEGGVSPSTWVINAELTGPDGVHESMSRPRAAWLHIVMDPSPTDPSRGVPPLQRANITVMGARATEDALLREGRQPSAAIIPVPDLGEGNESVVDDLRAKLENPSMTLALPPTTQSGWGAGGTVRPQTDWRPHRLKSEPTAELVDAIAQVEARLCAVLGAHPAIMGGAGATGTVDREARRQLMEGLVQPLGALIAYEASMTLGEEVRFEWPENPDVALVMARVEKTKVETEKLKSEPVESPSGSPGAPAEK